MLESLKVRSQCTAGCRKWAVRAGLMVVTPALLLGGIELALRILGYGHPSHFLVPAEGSPAFTTNEKFLQGFYPRSDTVRGWPFVVTQEKPTNSFRIFLLGESAALGTPNPSFGFARILERLARDQFPGRRIEIYNAALRGINSHVIRCIARECAGFKPDLFVVYMGNNEVVGLHGANPESNFVDRHLMLIRLSYQLKKTRLGQLLLSARGDKAPIRQDMAFFRAHRLALDDPRREPVYAHFRANLEDMIETMTSTRARVLLCTVPSNLIDCPPIGSINEPRVPESEKRQWGSCRAAGLTALKESRFAEAIGHFTAALAIDHHSADLHYRLAQSYFGLERFNEALREYRLARDWDGLQLRTDTRLNAIIREAADRSAGAGVVLVDAEKIFENSLEANHTLPGRSLFTDHVHLRFAGDYLMAKSLFAALVAGCPELGAPQGSAPSERECAERLAFNKWEDLQIESAAAQQMSHPPFLDQVDHEESLARAAREVRRRERAFTPADLARVRTSYEAALRLRPEDWQIHLNFGVFLMMTGNANGAVPHLEVPVRLFPASPSFRIRLADAFAHAGRHDEAIQQLREALRRDPESKVAANALGVLSHTGR